MRAYILNLESAQDRWAALSGAFERIGFPVTRVPGVEGAKLELPIPEYAEGRYRWFHGRPTNVREVGCYLSHVAACRAFLETPDEHGLICEDDLVLGPDFPKVLEAALRHRASWNILRLTGLSTGHAVPVHALGGGYALCVNFGRLKGAGAYVVNRAAARAFVAHLLPMWLPWDHAFDREELRRVVEFIRAGGVEATRARDLERWAREKRRKGMSAPVSIEVPRVSADNARFDDFRDVIYLIGRAILNLLKS